MVARGVAERLGGHPPGRAPDLLYPRGGERSLLHGEIRNRGTDRRAAGVHRGGDQRGGTLRRTLLLPPLRGLRLLRSGAERPHALRSASRGMDPHAVRLDRRGEGGDRLGAGRGARSRLRGALAPRGAFGPPGGAGDRGRRAPLLRKRGGRADQCARFRVAAHQP